MPKLDSFYWSDECEPHKKRTKEIIVQHPEIRKLIGKNPYTFFIILLCVGVQVTLAVLLSKASWWWVWPAAYFVPVILCLYVSTNVRITLFSKSAHSTQ